MHCIGRLHFKGQVRPLNVTDCHRFGHHLPCLRQVPRATQQEFAFQHAHLPALPTHAGSSGSRWPSSRSRRARRGFSSSSPSSTGYHDRSGGPIVGALFVLSAPTATPGQPVRSAACRAQSSLRSCVTSRGTLGQFECMVIPPLLAVAKSGTMLPVEVSALA